MHHEIWWELGKDRFVTWETTLDHSVRSSKCFHFCFSVVFVEWVIQSVSHGSKRIFPAGFFSSLRWGNNYFCRLALLFLLQCYSFHSHRTVRSKVVTCYNVVKVPGSVWYGSVIICNKVPGARPKLPNKRNGFSVYFAYWVVELKSTISSEALDENWSLSYSYAI